MKKVAVIMTALTLAAVMGCQDPVSDTGSDTAGVRFQAAIDGAQERAVGNRWTAGDAIGISMLERGGTVIAGSASNRKYVTEAGNETFAPASEAEAISVNRQVDFIAYYPYTGSLNGFRYPVDVSSQTNQEAIDLMTAEKTPADQTTRPVSLNFKHRLSGVVLQISAGPNVSTNELASVKAELTGQKVRGSYDINANQLLSAEGANQSVAFKMSADGKSGEVVILPASEGTGRTMKLSMLNSVTTKRETFTKTIADDKAFEAGVKYQFPITLNHKADGGFVVSGGFPGTIEDWTVVTEEASTLNPDGEEGVTPEPTPSPQPSPTGDNQYAYRNMERYQPVPYQPTGLTGAEAKGLIYSSYDTNNNYYVFLLGHVKHIPITAYEGELYNGSPKDFSYTYSSITTDAITTSIQNSYTNSVTDSKADTWGGEFGFTVGNKDIFSIEGKVTYSNTQATEEMNSRTTTSTLETMTQVSKTTQIGNTTHLGNRDQRDEPYGWYRYAYFVTSDVYYVMVTDRAITNLIDSYPVICVNLEKERGWILDYDEEGLFTKKNPDDLLKEPVLSLSELKKVNLENKIKEETSLPPIGMSPGIDVWGGKLTYTYKVTQAGTITATLVGGGSGGTGGAAKDGTKGWADAGWSAPGGDTKLYKNGELMKTSNGMDMIAKGGEKRDGPRQASEGQQNGYDGVDGYKEEYTFAVSVNDIIKIEVGYGGGGSGGAACRNNNDGASSGNAKETEGSKGYYRGSTASGKTDDDYAPRGGNGALHGLSSTGITSYSQKGETPPKAGDDQWGGYRRWSRRQ